MFPMTPLQSWAFIVVLAALIFLVLRLVFEIELRTQGEPLDDLDQSDDIETPGDQLYDWAEQGIWPAPSHPDEDKSRR